MDVSMYNILRVKIVKLYVEVPALQIYLPVSHGTERYNQRIFEEKQSSLKDNLSYAEPSFILSDYGLEAETIAVLNIPVLELSMPVYLGANEENMAAGAAHMSNTSLPIGGNNTNCVIAGHRGYSGADYFKYLDELKEGDSVQLVTLWNTLNYTVSEIRIIEPCEVEQIKIQEGRDLLTLLTCHPYASGGRYKVIINSAELEKYFGKEKTPRDMKDQIIKLLDEWKEKQPQELAKSEKKSDKEH